VTGPAAEGDAGLGSDGDGPADAGHLRAARLLRVAAAAVGAVLGVVYLVEAVRLGVGSGARPGPGLFPMAVGALLTVAATVLAVQAARGRLVAASDSEDDRAAEADGPGAAAGPDALAGAGPRVRLLTVLGALVCYVVGVGWVGHLITASLVTAAGTRMLGGRAWWICAAVGLVAGVGSQLVFGRLLGVPLPQGLYGPGFS
jgi:putative tricarboxylic transport membrane protein